MPSCLGCDRSNARRDWSSPGFDDTVALGLLDSIQAAYCQAKPNERRLLNQAFFEWLQISNEEVVGYVVAEPFSQLRGLGSADGDGSEAVKARLAETWSLEPEGARNAVLEPFAASQNAKTLVPSFGAEGSNVEALVRLRGVEPPRAVRPTRPSTLRVYQFRHSRLRGDDSRCLGVPGLLLAIVRVSR